MEPRPLRIAYAIEFLLALIAFFECWSQIGGQGPLDLMPWWMKIVFATAFSSLVVKVTSIAVRNDAPLSVPLVRWALALVLVLVIIALTTYYFHLFEPSDDENADEPVTTSFLYVVNACG